MVKLIVLVVLVVNYQNGSFGSYKNCKKEFFDNLEIKNNSKSFWDKYKPYFSNKHSKGDSDILLIEKDELLLKYKKVADIFNSYFQSITDSLDLFEWPLGSTDQIYDSVDRIIDSFRFHPSIKSIKRNYKITDKFSFWSFAIKQQRVPSATTLAAFIDGNT